MLKSKPKLVGFKQESGSNLRQVNINNESPECSFGFGGKKIMKFLSRFKFMA